MELAEDPDAATIDRDGPDVATIDRDGPDTATIDREDPGEPTIDRDGHADEATVLEALPDDEPTTIRPSREERDASVRPEGAKRRRIGKYELRDKLGSGAFGVVFTARDPSLDRDVAIKVLRPAHLGNPAIVQRFLQEARATARIAHPGIVMIHDCGQVETSVGLTAYIAMELLSGENLTQRLLRCGRLGPEIAIEISRQVASALEAAHRADVLHRDLKPDNIYLVADPVVACGERVKVLDFGLAKLGHHGHTQLQTVFGTPRYMSPEQCRSTAQVDHRSDIYSLGCILFELVTGQLPFDGDVRQLLDHHQRMIAPRARSFAPDVSPALDDLIAEMLAKDPMDRPQTMGAVQRALQLACEPLATEAVSAHASEPQLPRAGSEPRGLPHPEPRTRPGSEPRGLLHPEPRTRAGSEPRAFAVPLGPGRAPGALSRAGSGPRGLPPRLPGPRESTRGLPPLPHALGVPTRVPAEAASGEVLVPPSGARQVLTSEVPTSAFPRQSLARLVVLGLLIVVLSVLVAWITAA